MSQKMTRKSQNATAISEEKEKQENPAKDMKKKIAANTEKEKQLAEKTDKPIEKKDKPTEKKDKPAEKNDKSEPAEKHKSAEKNEKNADKPEKNDKSEKAPDKKSDKTEKSGDKKADKSIEKKPDAADKDGDKVKEKQAKPINGTHNGAPAANGDDANGTVSDGSEDDLVIEEDDIFPELTYDESDTDIEDVPSRSLTRRSQVKVTKTPETPRPASEKGSDDSKESKLLKLKDDSVASDRKLRSADSPKPESKKVEKKTQESPKKQESGQEEERTHSKKDAEKEIENAAPKDGKPEETSEKVELEVVVEVESAEGGPRTRARVSPYRAHHDRTATSTAAHYSGNNSTMEMDVTESSILEDSADNSGYLQGLRGIRGRNSYKKLSEYKLRPRPSPAASLGRPTGAVVGRKRKPSTDAPPAPAPPAHSTPSAPPAPHSPRGADSAEEADEDIFVSHGKRQRLLDRLSVPFWRNNLRDAEIVGINTDLPLTAPVASTSFASFEPDIMKPAALSRSAAPNQDPKRCILM